MKVLFITRDSDLPETHLMIGLGRSGFDVRILGNLVPSLEQKIRDAGLTAEPLAIRSRLDALAALKIRRVVREWNPDVVQCFTSRALTCAIAARLPRNVCLVAYRGAIGRLTRMDPSNVFGVLHRRVDGILCLSDSIVTALAKRGVPREKLFKIHKGHDPAWYEAPDPQSRTDRSVFRVGFIGNMRPVKGAHVLLEAMRRIDPVKRIKLVLIGEIIDPKARALIESPELAGRVEALGFQPEAFRRIREFDALAVPSLEGEGLSKAALEAMAQRVPVIASASGGLTELIEDRVSGRLVPPGDPRALADAIEEMALDSQLRERLAEKAYERVMSHYHIQRTIEQVASVYRTLCASASARKR